MENLIPFLTATLLKSAIVLLVALVAVLFMRRSSAAARHLVWAGAVAGVLALPVLSFLLPGWSAAPVASVVENSRMAPPAFAEAVAFEAGPAEPGLEESASVPEPAVSETVTGGSQGAGPPPVDAGIAERRGEALALEARASAGTHFSLSAAFRQWAQWIWLGGASFALLPLVLGTSGLFRLKRTARRVKDPAWLSLLAELSSELKVGRKVWLLESPVCTMPMTWGALPGLPAKIVIPEDALDEWTPNRRRAVLLHELAHVKRRDCLTQTLSQFACAFYWPNPLIWVAAHRMLVERERACDDLALRNAMQPSEYAKHLLEIATGHAGSPLARHAAVAMARPSGLGNRLVAVLDQRRNRKSLSRVAAVAAIALLGAVVVPVAMLEAEDGEGVRTVVVEETPYRAGLEEGVFVQLLGVRSWNTEGRRTRSWWAPDGGRTPVLLLDRAWSPPHADRDWYDVAIALSSPELDVVLEVSEVPYLAGGRAPDPSREDIEWDLPLLKFSVSGIDPEVSKADFAIGIETGEWTEAGRWDWPWEENPEGLPDHVNVSPPEITRSGNVVQVTVRHSYRDKAARIVLIDRQGSVHTREVRDRVGRATYSFNSLTLDEIESVVLQTRPYRWVEYENVSLRPGQTTDVEVNVRPD